MVSSFKKSLDILIKSKEFKKWKETSKESYLANGFLMLNSDYKENLDNLEWQIDFYSPNKDLMTSFFIKGGNISSKEGQKILKEEDVVIEELKLDKLKISLKDALSKIEKKYPKDAPNKVIIILQFVKVPVWNISFLTSSFNLLNVNIDAEKGNIIKESMKPLFEKF